MSKLQEYTEKAEASIAAGAAATSERERQFHARATAAYRKMIRGIAEAEQRAALQAAAPKKDRAPDRATIVAARLGAVRSS